MNVNMFQMSRRHKTVTVKQMVKIGARRANKLPDAKLDFSAMVDMVAKQLKQK